MPDAEILVPKTRLTDSLESDLAAVTKSEIGSDPAVPIPPQNIWPYIVGAAGSEHVTVRWYVHDLSPERTTEWVRGRSRALASAILNVLKQHGFPNGTNISVDGFLLPFSECAWVELKQD